MQTYLHHPLTMVIILVALSASLPAQELPAPDSEDFCVAVQKILANTEMQGNNTLFKDMPEYRHSKPSVEPLNIYQVVSYRGKLPIMVSCKVKTAAHLRSAYGENAAGEQRWCADVTRLAKAQAIAELRAVNAAAAEKAASFVVDDIEPFTTGRSYLADFQPSYIGDDGLIHFRSPGLFQDYDSWITFLLPKNFQGQSYCHLPTVNYMKALAAGEMEPGTTVTTADDAPVTPMTPSQ